MKKITFLLFVFLLMGFYGFSQLTTNLVFYNQDGNKFTVIMNGIRQNPNPETNVKITDLTQPYYKVKIIFDNKSLGEIEKALNYEQGTETVFEIKKNNKGVYVIRWQSAVPIAQAAPVSTGQTVVVYSPTELPNQSVTVTQTTQTTTVNNDPNVNSANVNIGLNAGGNNMNMNVNINDGSNGNVTQTTTTTTQTTTTNTNINTNVNPNMNPNVNVNVQTNGNVQNTPPPPPPPAHHHNTYVLQGYNGPIGCEFPMTDVDFANVKQSISSKSFEDSKLTIAKQVIAANCLLTRQVKEIMLLFSFEDSRLELAKYAYGYTYDTGNYYMLNDAFTFESSITELNNFITSRH